jgi:glutathione synthase/RimK-type ligase-like ATP-grasp enzyme
MSQKMKKYKFAILKNETDSNHLEWIDACDVYADKCDYTVIDLTKSDWLEQILVQKYDCFLLRPPGRIEYFKKLYDERVYIMSQMLNLPIYPTYEETLIYENKRMLAYWLHAMEIPHASTRVIYDKNEALDYVNDASFPFLAKTAIGASGSGVTIIKSGKQAKSYINKAFGGKGIRRTWLPNRRKGRILQRLKNRLKDFPELIRYLKRRRRDATIEPQKWYVIFQEYLNVVEEWRCVRIGDSFFAHKKQRRGDRFSGGGGIDWDPPTEEILDFMKMVTDKRGFLSQAIDIFVTEDNKLYLNELQCFFGFIHPQHQMIINGAGGRFRYIEGKWKFEEGTFNENNSFNLRLQHVIELVEKGFL